MDRNEYIRSRVEDQIAWYGRKAEQSQRAFRTLRLLEIVAAAMIPLLAVFSDRIGTTFPVVVGLLGFAVTVLAGLLALYRFQENWVHYRSTCEALKHERILFETGTGPYEGEDAFSAFVERFENLLATERQGWARYAGQKTEGKPQA